MSSNGQTNSSSTNNTTSSRSESHFDKLSRFNVFGLGKSIGEGSKDLSISSESTNAMMTGKPAMSALSHKDSFGRKASSSSMIASNSTSFPVAFDEYRKGEGRNTSPEKSQILSPTSPTQVVKSTPDTPESSALNASTSRDILESSSTTRQTATQRTPAGKKGMMDNAEDDADKTLKSQALETPQKVGSRQGAPSKVVAGNSAAVPAGVLTETLPNNSGLNSTTNATAGKSNGAVSTSKTNRLHTRRSIPQLPCAINVGAAPPPAMYWSKAPIHGSIPKKSFRAHTANLTDEMAWLFGGCDSKGCFRELWCFDTETMYWSKPKVSGDLPPPRRAHTATMVDKRLFIFAGGDGPYYFNDLYMFDTVSLRWTKPEVYGQPPSPRRAHTSNYYEGQLVIFGGGNGIGALNDVYTLDISDPDKLEWRKIECTGKVPAGRGYHTSNLVDGKLIVIGGSDGHMSFNDIYILRLDTHVWYQVKTDEIHNRLGHTATQVGSYLFIIGGHDSHGYTPEILTLNLVNLQWEPRRVCGQKPAGRGYHQAWLRDSRLFVHGGFDGKEVFDDLYYIDLAACAYLPQITSFNVELDDEDEY